MPSSREPFSGLSECMRSETRERDTEKAVDLGVTTHIHVPIHPTLPVVSALLLSPSVCVGLCHSLVSVPQTILESLISSVAVSPGRPYSL